jgi:SAM-dependent methyltransferase
MSSILNLLKRMLPKSAKRVIRRIFFSKYDSELSFWRGRLEIDKGTFKNSHYKRIMLAMAAETNEEFLRDKIVADFGCGPRGSLVWAEPALLRIGIDVLADRYADEFKSSIISHGMIYLKSTELVIPLPSSCVDVMFTLNAMDHVSHFPEMCNEILRVLKPGGEFIASFNLEEPPTACEPQQLNEMVIKDHLLNHMEILLLRKTKKGPPGDQYAPFFESELSYVPGQEGFLWVRAKKTGSLVD